MVLYYVMSTTVAKHTPVLRATSCLAMHGSITLPWTMEFGYKKSVRVALKVAGVRNKN